MKVRHFDAPGSSYHAPVAGRQRGARRARMAARRTHMTRSRHSAMRRIATSWSHSGGALRVGARGIRRPVLAALLAGVASLAASSDLRLELEHAPGRRPSAPGGHRHRARARAPCPSSTAGAASTSACRRPAGSPSRPAGPPGAQSVRLLDAAGSVVAVRRLHARGAHRDRGRGRPHEGPPAPRPEDARAAERQRHPDRGRHPRVAGEVLRLLRPVAAGPRAHDQGHEVLRRERRRRRRLLPRDAARGRDDLGLLQPWPGAQLLRDGLRPARLRAPLRRRRDGPHAGRGGRRVPLRRGRLLRLEVHRRRRLDGAASSTRPSARWTTPSPTAPASRRSTAS